MNIIAKLRRAIEEQIPGTAEHLAKSKLKFKAALRDAGYTRSQLRRIARARFHKDGRRHAALAPATFLCDDGRIASCWPGGWCDAMLHNFSCRGGDTAPATAESLEVAGITGRAILRSSDSREALNATFQRIEHLPRNTARCVRSCAQN